MIKIFDANDRDFSTAGNIIIEPIKCIEYKKKSLNGWYIEVEIPIKYKEYISKDKLCVVKTKSKLNPQAFRIEEDIEYSTRKIKFKANHVMFDAKDYVLLDVRPTNQNGLNALNYINERTDNLSPFSIYSNVENVNTAYFIRKNLLEAWTTIEERWGGVFDADNWNISFLTSVGNDNGETIAYGKNMQGFDIYEDWSSVCTKLLPVGYDGLLLPEKYLKSDVQYEKPYTRVVDFETSLDIEEQTEENLLSELRQKAEAYLEENKVPKISYTIISNVNQTLEIGDTIKVLHPLINIFTEVLEYAYNLISKKVVSLTFGNYSRDVRTKFNNIKNTIETIRQTVSKQDIIINEQTSLINSLNKNGYVYIDDNEILILDKLPKEEAKNVWRFGLGGIGFSSNGYEGPFEIAITMDGQINANFITTGTMSVDRIESLANFITDTNKAIATIELQQNSIITKVSSVETLANSAVEGVNNITNTQGEAEGKSIHIEDSAEEPFVDIKLLGESTQETRSGKNHFDASQIPSSTNIVVSDNGKTITMPIVTSGNGATPTTKKLSQLCPKLKVGDIATLRFSRNLGNTYNNFIYLSGISLEWGMNASKTITQEMLDSNVVLYANRYNNGETGQCILTDFSIMLSSETDTSWEQYGASPSPDNPSEIENIEGNIEFKVEGKNKFDCANSRIIYNHGNASYERLENGLKLISSGGKYNMIYFLVDTVENLKGKTLTLSSDISFSKEKQQVSFGLYYTDFNSGNRKSFGIIESIKTEGYYTIKGTVEEGENREYVCIGLRPNMASNYASGDYTIYDNLQVEIGETASDYEPYKSQVATFPLGEEKLMEGSYLADDGIHHKRKQVILPEISVLNQTTLWNTELQFANFTFSDMKIGSRNYNFYCNKVKPSNEEYSKYSGYTVSGRFVIVTDLEDTVENFNNNIAGSILEYELAEEEIVPYTEEQQEQWNKIKAMYTYKNITNITSDAYAKVVYMRDNGLDVYETKQNAQKRYTETTKKLAEQKITSDEIKSSVTETKDSVNALSNTIVSHSESISSLSVAVGQVGANVTDLKESTEQSINDIKATSSGLSMAITNIGGNNLIRNSAMINGNNFWLAHAKYPYQESDIPPDNPAEGTYWYCTANSGSYIENQMYLYTNNEWQESAISKKALLSTQNYMANTTSNEYWANGKNANENTLSGRVIKLDGRQDYTVSHIFNITEPITLNQNENKTAISYFVKNNIIQGSVGIGLMFLDFTDLTTIEKPYSIYEPGILLTPDDLKDLTKIESIINIPQKSDFIPVVVSNTAPTDTTKTWLDASIYLPKVYNADTSQWELLDTRMSLYNEETREIWTYRYFYGFYYQTPVSFDTLEIKSCYVALTFYPAFAVYTGDTEPIPYKGLYWNNQTTNLVKRAKYNNTDFVEWETLDIPSSMLPSGASLGVPMFDYIVPIKGFFEIADLKLEYNAICTKWTQFPGEVYGKNYKMDEKGFWIQANQNTMFIDEDEILATYKGINIFQINKDLAYFYKIQATESIEVGNYFLKTQQINSKNMLLLY